MIAVMLIGMLAMALALALGPIASFAQQPVEEPEAVEELPEAVEEPVEEEPVEEEPDVEPEAVEELPEPVEELPEAVEPQVELQVEQPEEEPANKITICHWEPAEGGKYVQITVANEAVANAHARNHRNDIVPAPEGGCPTGTATATATATASPEPRTTICHFEEPEYVELRVTDEVAEFHLTNHPNDTEGPCPTGTATATATATAEPTTPEPTTVSPEPTTVSPTATATATASPAPPCEEPGREVEVTGPDGEVTTITLCDLDVGDPGPHPGGPGGIGRSEARGEVAAAEALLAGEDFGGAADAAEPHLDAEDSRDAARLMAAQLGETLPETGGPVALSVFAAALLLVGGGFAWRLGMGGRR